MEPMEDPERGQAQVMALLARAREHDRAPDALRARIGRDRAAARASRNRRSAYGAAVAATLAAVAVVLALVLPSGAPGVPSVVQAAVLSSRGAVQPAPAALGAGRLDASIGGVSFPNWQPRFGWRATGARRDTIDGRTALTVYYARGADRVAYTVLDATSPRPQAPALWVGSLELRTMRVGGATVVSWHEGKATCLLVSSQAPAGELASLAAWSE